MLHSLTWVDGLVLVIIFAHAVRGAFTGAVRQVFGILGALVGLWAALWIARWVGQHWLGARPALLFWILRGLVAGLGGLAVASLIQLAGDRIGEAVKASVAGGLDRAAGLVLGAATGTLVVTILLLAALIATRPRAIGETAARTRFAVPLMSAGARLTSLRESTFPGSAWLRRRFLDAERRARAEAASF